jgi:hypothetical protein
MNFWEKRRLIPTTGISGENGRQNKKPGENPRALKLTD